MAVTVSQTFLVFDNLNRFEEYWSCICRMSLNWEHELSNVFLMIRLGLWVFGRKTTEAKGPSHHAPSRVCAVNMTYTVDVDLSYLVEVCLSGFTTAQLLFISPFPHCLLQEEVAMHSPYIRSGGLCFPP